MSELIEQIGACRFCGQMKTFHVAREWSDEKLNETATRECSCKEGRRYGTMIESKEKAEEAIERLFGEDSDLRARSIPIAEEVPNMMKALILYMVHDALAGATLDLGFGVSAKIQIKANGKIKVKRTITEHREEEQ